MTTITRENRLLLSLFFSVSVMTVVTFISLAFSEMPLAQEAKQSERQPASIGPVKIKPHQIKVQSVFVDLCSDEISPKKTNSIRGEFVQIRGKNCSKSKTLDELKIVNSTNGYTASVLSAEISGEYQTDLIQMNPGQNEISIQYQSAKGEILEQKIKLNVQIEGKSL